MQQIIYFCDRCKRQMEEGELLACLYFQEEVHVAICPTCVASYQQWLADTK